MSTNKTKYRIANYDGYKSFLEYEVEKRGFFLNEMVWKKVWKPYYDTFNGRYENNICLGMGLYDSNLYVNSYDGRNVDYLENFTKEWPDISEYFKWASIEQQKLEDKAKKYHSDIESKKGIKYL